MANTNNYNQSMSFTSKVMEKNGERTYNYYQSTQLPKEEIASEITDQVLYDKRTGTATHEHWLDVNHGVDNYLQGDLGQDMLVQERTRTKESTIDKKTGLPYNDFTIRYRRDGNWHEDRVESEIYKLINTINQHPEEFILSYGVVNDDSPSPGVDPIPSDETRFIRYVQIDLHAFVNEIVKGNIVLDDPDENGKRPGASYVDTEGKVHLAWRMNKDKSSAFIAADVGQLAIYFPGIVIDHHGFRIPTFEQEFDRQKKAGAFGDPGAPSPELQKFKDAGIEVRDSEPTDIWASAFGDFGTVFEGHQQNIMRLQFELDIPLDVDALWNLTEENQFDLDKRIAAARVGEYDWADLKNDLVALDFVLDDGARVNLEKQKAYVLEETAKNRAKHPNRPVIKTIFEKAIERGQELRKTRPDLYVKTPAEIAHNEARKVREADYILSFMEFDELPKETQDWILQTKGVELPDPLWNEVTETLEKKDLTSDIKAQHAQAVSKNTISRDAHLTR